jgi:hypothetical protein
MIETTIALTLALGVPLGLMAEEIFTLVRTTPERVRRRPTHVMPRRHAGDEI